MVAGMTVVITEAEQVSRVWTNDMRSTKIYCHVPKIQSKQNRILEDSTSVNVKEDNTNIFPISSIDNSFNYLQTVRRLDKSLLDRAKLALRESYFYYEHITSDQAHAMLRSTKIGTFLVRTSNHPHYKYSISVQTDMGPKSVRLLCWKDRFQLESVPIACGSMPHFDTVIDLIQYYVDIDNGVIPTHSGRTVWIDDTTKLRTSIVQIHTPLKRKSGPPSLKHLARVAINRIIHDAGKNVICGSKLYNQLEMPDCLKTYMARYPYWI